MGLSSDDVQNGVPAASVLADPFDAILAHLDDAGAHVEEVYRLDKAGGLADPKSGDLSADLSAEARSAKGEARSAKAEARSAKGQARALVLRQVTRAAALLRDLTQTAWVRSGEPVTLSPADNPILQTHPHYNPATGSAPAPRPRSDASGVGVSGYRPLSWPDPVSGKNFPWFAMIEAQPSVRQALAEAPALRAILDQKRKSVSGAATACALDLACHVKAFAWSEDEIARVRDELIAASRRGALTPIVNEMRRSGLFEHDRALDPEAVVARAWERSASGLNNIIAVYGTGQKPRYPAIDSVSHDVAAQPYRALVNTAVGVLEEERSDWTLFYQPTLAFARTLLDINWRDEAGRFEPLHLGENAAAYKRIPTVSWSDYPYTVIVVPGAGTDRPDAALGPQGKMRIALAARRYHQRKAPFLLVSGGYVHPNQTKFNEALEMKRSLVRDFNVPESAILIDPHARHTTTNLRNAARIVFRYGIPTDRVSLITTDQYQSDYIEGTVFADRCDRELGYRPYELKRRVSRYDLEWLPRVESLHADPLDPLDP
jgi:hypothetical protein